MNTNSRGPKLGRLLDSILNRTIALTPQNGKLFLEAICSQQDKAACINKLIASRTGISSVQASMRFDLTPTFFNSTTTAFLSYIQAPEIRTIACGEFLKQLVLDISEPPIFWDAFRKAFLDGLLQENATSSFAWLLLQLVSLPEQSAKPYRDHIQNPAILQILLGSLQVNARVFGEKIKHVLSTCSTTPLTDGDDNPGGRHDNDYADFRAISILPTADEIVSTERSFLRPSSAIEDPKTESNRLAIHLDNQFRLLREDMLYEMREELQIAFGRKKGYHRGLVIRGLTMLDVHCGEEDRRCKWGVALQCRQDLPQFGKVKFADRRKHLNENRNIFRHQSLACLIVDGKVVAFPTVNRDEDLLARKPPVIVLQLEGELSTTNALLWLKMNKPITLIQIDTAIFSYEPVLKALQQTTSMPLSRDLLVCKTADILLDPLSQLAKIVHVLRSNPRKDLQSLLGTSKSVVLDTSQAASLLSGLTQKVSLIQGPPGTGKSFIGAILAKALHDSTQQTILVVCYTNHALDDVLSNLLDIGIPARNIVRLGGKSTSKTESMTLQNQKSGYRWGREDWNVIKSLQGRSEGLYSRLKTLFDDYKSSNTQYGDILEYLEFEEPTYYEAFRVPQATDGMIHIGKKGKVVNAYYLLHRWSGGKNAGIYQARTHIVASSEIWELTLPARKNQLTKWQLDILKEKIASLYTVATNYNDSQDMLLRKRSENVAAVLRTKRIIGCTTTAAAKYSDDIQGASPGVLLVEEAGEILESHVLTALGSDTTQLILIGDHKQLRPKVNNYLLTVEKGEGYDLNRSLFERLILKGYPHATLSEQHRMRPEISSLIRELTYPDLVDAAKTKTRPDLRGVEDNIVFINHDHQEDETLGLSDRGDTASTSSKQNTFEVDMVLKIVRYLAQQGYGTDKIVILTPYLGQLQRLQVALRKDNDPILNDLDSFDLVRAGLLPAAAAQISKKSIRLATIDNYQGEESDIVIASLTRSNPTHDIGFMFSPERLNVLLSRARDALIIIGNADTFSHARKGADLWNRLFDLLKRGGHIYGGLPARCERHKDHKVLLTQPINFDEMCPDGGCLEPCGAMLNCGQHICPSKCHQLYDHSKMPCQHILSSKCSKGHLQKWKCNENIPPVCTKCEREAKLAELKRQQDYDLQQKREADQLAHARRLAELDESITREILAKQDEQLAKERCDVIRQKEKDLEALTSSATQRQHVPVEDANAPPCLPIAETNENSLSKPIQTNMDYPQIPNEGTKQSRTTTSTIILDASPISPAQIEWERQKTLEGASNDAIDGIMAMIGLEEVKEQVLEIKVKIDATRRQNASLKRERFNIVLLGNPGTGKTTVARLYAKFLTSVQVLPGEAFIETTGSRLANEGVAGIKTKVEEVLNTGGGAIFVDEAYQLTSQHNFQGGQVLDFLLAEMENNIGKIVFILAGYNKQMERFFEHNPGLTSRVPYRLHFHDYKDHELILMLEDLIQKEYQGRMKVEDGIRGLYCRIVVRRLGRGRDREGFGNARALHNLWAQIRGRQAKRLYKERKDGLAPDDFVLCKEDLIGSNPSVVIRQSEAWSELQSLIGLNAVKQSVGSLFDRIQTNYERELQEKKPVQTSLNRVFLGSPGTGKTSVAKLYGRILADLGLISNGEVVVKNPADFVGSVLGQSEENTKAILANTIGKVLIIDEAYMLYGGGSNAGKDGNIYNTAVIDTIVAEVQSDQGEDRCVLLLGYKEQMIEMFQNVNPGLSRRFAIEDAFYFEDFDDLQLMDILNLKLKNQDLDATDEAKSVAIDMLSRARNRLNFGNAGEVENIIGQAKGRHQTRQAVVPLTLRSQEIIFQPEDFDPDFNRQTHASNNLSELFKDVVGSEDIVTRLRKYQQLANALKTRHIDPRGQIPTNFVFKGPPGTGKTTVARKMGQVYYDMGFLSSAEVIECSATDLVAPYVGQTGAKSKKLFEKALGRVLFIDEAYRLGEGQFAKEAIDEMVGLLTHPIFSSKLVVVLAGYDGDMNRLMQVNTGLSSRFPDQISFVNISPQDCLEILRRELDKMQVHLVELDDPTCPVFHEMTTTIEQLSSLQSWGNARDMKSLSREMISAAMLGDDGSNGDFVTLNADTALDCMNAMLISRREQSKVTTPSGCSKLEEVMSAFTPLQKSTLATKAATKTKTPAIETVAHEETDGRDIGVTDIIWRQLQDDILSAERATWLANAVCQKLERDIEENRIQMEFHKTRSEELAQTRAKDTAEQDELKRKHEEARLKENEARIAHETAVALLEKKREEEEARRRVEAKAQAALRRMGVCVAGYRWIKQASGYRCAGGSHFVGNDALGI